MKRVEQILVAVVASAILMAVLPPSASSQQQSQQPAAATQAPPPGPGRDTFTRVCSGCHMTALATRLSRPACISRNLSSMSL
jgi:cytochrome c5